MIFQTNIPPSPLSDEEIIAKVNNFFNHNFVFDGESTSDWLKKICVQTLFDFMGVRCAVNHKTREQELFALTVGEALSNILNLHLDIAPIELKYIKYNGINFVNFATEQIVNLGANKAFLNLYELLEQQAKNIRWD